MKSEITIYKGEEGYFAEIEIKHDFLITNQTLISKSQVSKGQAKRKAIQFCGDLNLVSEVVTKL